MKILTVAAFMFLLTGCANVDGWTHADAKREIVFAAVMAIDAAQTMKIRDNPGVHEVGWARAALGDQPTVSGTVVYFGTLTASHWLIARALPHTWRKYWQGAAVAIETPTIRNNCQLSLGC